MSKTRKQEVLDKNYAIRCAGLTVGLVILILAGGVLVSGRTDDPRPHQPLIPLIAGVQIVEATEIMPVKEPQGFCRDCPHGFEQLHVLAWCQDRVQTETEGEIIVRIRNATVFCNSCGYERDSPHCCQNQSAPRKHCSDCGYYVGSDSCCKTNKHRVDAPLPVQPCVRGSISSQTLSREYEANEIRADSKYGGGLYRVYGIVQSIGIGTFGGYYVSLEGDGWLSGVHCSFTVSSYRLENLKKGDHCTIKGIIDRGGTTVLSVTVSNCEIVD